MTIKAELCKIFDSHNIIYNIIHNISNDYISCKSKKGEVAAISNSGTKLFLYTRPTILG